MNQSSAASESGWGEGSVEYLLRLGAFGQGSRDWGGRGA